MQLVVESKNGKDEAGSGVQGWVRCSWLWSAGKGRVWLAVECMFEWDAAGCAADSGVHGAAGS